ncbi:MAG: thiolase family protein [Acidimicrobiaceae bacterium]|nr:thiolase family protein [Acidimicrobiaceae bacterium]
MPAMTFQNVRIVSRGYWSSPFHRWHGAFADKSPIQLAAECGRLAAAQGRIDLEMVDQLHLGVTIPSPAIFFGAPRMASLLGAPAGVTGPTISQACATSAAVLASAAAAVELGDSRSALAVCADRTSNGPHLYYPRSSTAPGISEDWVWDNFTDPDLGHQMIASAENIAAEGGYTRRDQDEMTVLRHTQYDCALADDRAFQRSYMIEPDAASTDGADHGDSGPRRVTVQAAASKNPVLESGTVTALSQTFPADGNAGVQLVNGGSGIATGGPTVRLLGYATARARPAFMGQAPVPAAQSLLDRLSLKADSMTAIKTHNPFAVNDVYLCEQLGLEWDRVNNFGSSLTWGHPQGPTGLRLVVELIEELCAVGGGYGLFTGCAAGDSAAAIVVRVDV